MQSTPRAPNPSSCPKSCALLSLALLPFIAPAADAPTVLAPFEVTGSRVKRLADDALLDVRRFQASDLTLSGQPTVADFLRALPWNVGGAPTTASAVNLNAGQTGISFRGLGSSNTLVLLNGRRLALFGQADGSTLSADVGNLPAAAIESIEVLREGASALYGSDAVAGVVNVKLRPSFEGARMRWSYRQLADTDWGRQTADLTWGGSHGDLRMLLVLDYTTSNDVRFADRPVSRTEDLRAIGGRDLRQNFGWPGQVFLPADLASAPPASRGGIATIGTVNNGVVTIGAPTRTVRAEDFVRLPSNVTNGVPTPGDSQNNFDRAPHTSMIPAEEGWGIHTHLEQSLGGEMTAFAELGWRRRELTTSLHPTPAGTSLESASGVGDGPGGAIIFPRINPYNPFGVDLSTLQFQLVELGPRIRQFTNDTPRALLGLRGQWIRDWEWEAAVLVSRNTVYEDTRNYILDADLQAGLSGRLGGFLNPFGPSDPGVIDRARTSLHAKQQFRLQLADFRARGELFRLPAGAWQAAVGAEARRDDYRGEPSDLAARGAYAAWAALTRRSAGRDVRAVFAEVEGPLAKHLDARVAARGEDYSDFGYTAKPTVALAWGPWRWLSLRASRAESFKAPELLDLYADQTEYYAVIDDPLRPDLGSYAARYRTGGNPDLLPEEGESWTLGATVAPGRGFTLGASWWQVRKTGMVGGLGIQFVLHHERDPAFPTADRVVRRVPGAGSLPGEIVLINDTRGNIDEVDISGWDFDLAGRWQAGNLGEFHVGAAATWLREWTYLSRTAGSSHRLGSDGLPEWRGQATIGWHRAGWEASVSTHWIGRHQGGGVNYAGGSTDQGARAFVNLHLGRALPGNTHVALTVTNVFDTDPPVHFASSRAYSGALYDNLGLGYGLSLEKGF